MKVLLAAAILVALITPAMAKDDEDNVFKWERESRKHLHRCEGVRRRRADHRPPRILARRHIEGREVPEGVASTIKKVLLATAIATAMIAPAMA